MVPPTLQSYDIATELVARGVATWCASKEEEGEAEGEGEGRGENGKEEGEGGETGEDEEAEEEEEEDADEGDEKEKDADEGDEEEKETDEEGVQEKSLQVGSVASDEGGGNSMVVAAKTHVRMYVCSCTREADSIGYHLYHRR